jgi:hypothetical protein
VSDLTPDVRTSFDRATSGDGHGVARTTQHLEKRIRHQGARAARCQHGVSAPQASCKLAIETSPQRYRFTASRQAGNLDDMALRRVQAAR